MKANSSNLQKIRDLVSGIDRSDDRDSTWTKLSQSTCMKRAVLDELAANPLHTFID